MKVVDIESLYKTLAPKVTNYLVANGTSYSLACDIVQETFLRIWKMRDRLDESSERIAALAHTIARNIRNDKFRHDKLVSFQDEIKDNELVSNDTAPAPGDDKYLKNRLTTALSALPPLLREAFLLFQISELPIREIAIQLNISESLAKVRIFRAKTKLKELLADLGDW